MTDDTLPRETLVPPGGRLTHGHWICRLLHHRGMRWEEDVERYSETGRRITLVEATCTVCERAQPWVRVVYPPSRTITVSRRPPTPKP